MNKKIVILHPAFWEQAMGGAEVQIKYLVNFLLEKNVQVHYIYEDKGISIKNKSHKNLILHPLSRIKLSKRFGNRWFLYQNKINLILNQVQPDGIYTRFFSSWSGFASEYALKHSIPHIWAIASDNDLKVLERSISLIKPLDIIENRYVKRAFKLATDIIVQNKWQEVELQQKHNRKGLFLKQAAPYDNKNLVVKSETVLKIVWIANMKSLKRPDLFVNLVKHFREFKEVKFEMIGRMVPKYKNIIKQEEENNAMFEYLGELSNAEVNEVLLGTDILINTSDYEGFSNTFIQAWLRKNIVMSMNSNPDDILTTYEVGFLCPTIDQMIQKITFLKKNKDVLRTMQDTAMKYVLEEHNLENNLNIIGDLLKLEENGTTLV